MPADDLYRACAEAYFIAHGYRTVTPEIVAHRARQRHHRAVVDLAVRAGREQAAAEIRARAEQIELAPREPYGSMRMIQRRSLMVAASIAAGPLNGGHTIACTADDIEDPAAPAQTAASGTTPPGEGDPVGADASGAQRGAQAVVDGTPGHGRDWTGYDERMGWYAARCTCGYTAVSRYSLLGAARILDDHLAARAEADRA